LKIAASGEKKNGCMKVLGLDMGQKRIGIAISDEFGWTAQGLRILYRRSIEDDILEIKNLILNEKVTAVVVGLPKNMDGSLGIEAQKVLSFVKMMERSLPIPIILWDERLTTSEATRLLIKADLSRKKRRKVIDKLAAVLILQTYLDSLGRDENRKDEQ
jgi:putative Holliday junction resolvase